MTLPWSACSNQKTLDDQAVDFLVRIANILVQCEKSFQGRCSHQELDEMVQSFVAEMHDWARDKLRTSPQYLAYFGQDQSADMQAVVEAITTGQATDPDFAHAVVTHLSVWLLIAQLGDGYHLLLPEPAARLVDYTLSICEATLCRKAGIGIMSWVFPVRIALLIPLEAIQRRSIVFSRQVDSNYSCELMTTSVGFPKLKDDWQDESVPWSVSTLGTLDRPKAPQNCGQDFMAEQSRWEQSQFAGK